MGNSFDEIFKDLEYGEPNEINSVKDALSVVALGAAASDGTVSSEERFRFVAIALGSPLFSNDIEDIIAEATRLAHFVNKLGVDKTINIAEGSLSSELKETAFSWAVDIVIADGWLDERERAYLEMLVEKFALDPEKAKKIVEVTKIRNRVR